MNFIVNRRIIQRAMDSDSNNTLCRCEGDIESGTAESANRVASYLFTSGMSSDYLTDFLLKCTPSKEKKDVILNLLLSYIIKTDKTLSEDTRYVLAASSRLIQQNKDLSFLAPGSGPTVLVLRCGRSSFISVTCNMLQADL